jgi:hypothetical protein
MSIEKQYSARDVMQIALACDTTVRTVRAVLRGEPVSVSRARARVYRHLANGGLLDLIAEPPAVAEGEP